MNEGYSPLAELVRRLGFGHVRRVVALADALLASPLTKEEARRAGMPHDVASNWLQAEQSMTSATKCAAAQ